MFSASPYSATAYSAQGQVASDYVDFSTVIGMNHRSLLFDQASASVTCDTAAGAIPSKGYPVADVAKSGAIFSASFIEAADPPVDMVSGLPLTPIGNANVVLGRWGNAREINATGYNFRLSQTALDVWSAVVTVKFRNNKWDFTNIDVETNGSVYAQPVFMLGNMVLMLNHEVGLGVNPNPQNNRTTLTLERINIADYDSLDLDTYDPDGTFNAPVVNGPELSHAEYTELFGPDAGFHERFNSTGEWTHVVVMCRKSLFSDTGYYEYVVGLVDRTGSFYYKAVSGAELGNYFHTTLVKEAAASADVPSIGDMEYKVSDTLKLADLGQQLPLIIGTPLTDLAYDIDQITIFDRELTPADIEALYRDTLMSPVFEEITEQVGDNQTRYRHDVVGSPVADDYGFDTLREALQKMTYSVNKVFAGVQDQYSIIDYDNVFAQVSGQTRSDVSVSLETGFTYQRVIEADVHSQYTFQEPVFSDVHSATSFPAIEEVSAEVSTRHSFLQPVNAVVPDDEYTTVSAAGIGVQNDVYLTVNGNRLGIISGDVSTSEGLFVWRAAIVLADFSVFEQFTRDTEFTVHINGDTYAFVVTRRSREYDSPAGKVYKVEGMSPTIRHKAPFASVITKDYPDAMQARAYAESVDPSIDWRILDWQIPGGSLSVDRGTEISMLSEVVAAVGAVLETTREGQLYARYKFPVSPRLYGVTQPDLYLTARTDMEKYDMPDELVDYADCLHISSSSGAQVGDTMEWEQDADNPNTGILTVYLSPDREGTYVAHTSRNISITLLSDEYEEKCEDVEFIDGAGNVQYPVKAIVDYEWQFEDLGAVSFDGNGLTVALPGSKYGYSLLQIQYTTRVIKYRVTGYEPLAQLLLIEG